MKRYFICLIILSVLFSTTCKKEESETEDPSVVTGTIVGEHRTWTEVGVSFGAGKPWATKAPIIEEKFNLTLPIPTIDLGSLFGNIPIQLDNINSQAAYASFYARKDTDTVSLSLFNSTVLPPSATFVQYLYVDRDLEIKRSIPLTSEQLEPLLVLLELPIENIPSLKVTLEIDLKLKKGWNTSLNVLSPSLSGLTLTMKNGKAPSEARWMAARDTNIPFLK